MTTTIGAQFRPYLEEDTSTKEKEAIPCEMVHTGTGKFRGPPAGTEPYDDLWGKCPNEATFTGVCPIGDQSVNVCESCLHNQNLDPTGDLTGILRMIPRDLCGHAPLRQWAWFKR